MRTRIGKVFLGINDHSP